MKNLIERIGIRKLASRKSIAYRLAVDEEELTNWENGSSFPDEKTINRFKKEFRIDPNNEKDRMPISKRERVANKLMVISFVAFFFLYILCFLQSFWPYNGATLVASFVGVHIFFAYFLTLGIMNRKHSLSGLCFLDTAISLLHIIISNFVFWSLFIGFATH